MHLYLPAKILDSSLLYKEMHLTLELDADNWQTKDRYNLLQQNLNGKWAEIFNDRKGMPCYCVCFMQLQTLHKRLPEVIITDHLCLEWFNKMKHPSGCLVKWISYNSMILKFNTGKLKIRQLMPFPRIRWKYFHRT